MSRRRVTYVDGAAQLCIAGVPGPQAQGLLFEQRAAEHVDEQWACPCCGGPRAATRATCERCEIVGASPLTLGRKKVGTP